MQKRILKALRESNPDTISSGSTLTTYPKIARNRFTRLRANFSFQLLRLTKMCPISAFLLSLQSHYKNMQPFYTPISKGASLAHPASFPMRQLTFEAGGGW
jgi:hypothetical protein